MQPGKFRFSLLSNRSLAAATAFAALAAAAVIYWAFIAFSINSIDRLVEDQLDKTAESISTQLGLKFERNSIEAKYISLNNAIMYLLELNLDNTQLKDICRNIVDGKINNGDAPAYGEIKSLTVLKHDGTVAFTNSALFQDPGTSPVKLTEKYYEEYISGDSIYYLIYYPITKISPVTKKSYFIGAVVSTYNILDFAGIAQKSLINTTIGANFELRGYSSSRLSFVVRPDSIFSAKEAGALSSFSDPAAEKVMPITNKSSRELDVKLSICISSAEYEKIKAARIKAAAVAATAMTALLFAALVAMIFILRVKMSKSIKARLAAESLRVQKHDFVKHISIVDGLIKLNEMDMLKKYIHSINDNLIYFEDAGRIDNSAVLVLIRQKESECQKQGIAFTVRTNTALKDLPVSEYDLCTMLGNLMDNAIEAAVESPGAKKVDLELSWQVGMYVFTVTNTGKEIKSRSLKKVFKYGFTTKNRGKGRGFGLYIVRKLVKKYSGMIDVSSKDGVTAFTVFIPEKEA